jgi:hypothetical protein
VHVVRKSIVIGLLVALLAVGMAGPTAAKKKPASKGKAVKTVLYLDGDMDIAEMEDPLLFQKLSPTKPDGATPKSKGILNYVAGPNETCAGNSLFPVFVGPFSGTVTGPITIILNTVSTPGASVDLRIWPDVGSQLCDSAATGAMDYVEPSASVVAPLPAGPGVLEVETSSATFEAQALLMFQVTPVLVPPFVGRVLYDAAGYESRIEFMCIPPKGEKSCV